MSEYLILPGMPDFDETIACIMPFDWQQIANKCDGFQFVARAGSGLLEAVPNNQVIDYLYGGEYDERLNEIGENEDNYFEYNEFTDSYI